MSADEGLQVEEMRVESNGRKRGRINNGGEGLLWRTLEVDSLFKRSAKAVPWGSPQRSDRRNDRRNFKLCELHRTSTPHHTTKMCRIEEALAAIKILDEGEHFTYTNIANNYGVSRVTLARRHQGIQASRTEQAIKQQLLNPQQELELVKYIKKVDRGWSSTHKGHDPVLCLYHCEGGGGK
jgi:hypothetical protein